MLRADPTSSYVHGVTRYVTWWWWGGNLWRRCIGYRGNAAPWSTEIVKHVRRLFFSTHVRAPYSTSVGALQCTERRRFSSTNFMRGRSVRVTDSFRARERGKPRRRRKSKRSSLPLSYSGISVCRSPVIGICLGSCYCN